MSALEDRLFILEAKDEIRELTARYCHAVVEGDVQGVVELFCKETGTFHMGRLSPCGHAELTEFYGNGISRRTHKPFVQNHVIAVDDEANAHGRLSVEIRVWQDEQAFTQAGHYHDCYRVEDGRWRFLERRFTSYHLAAWREGWQENFVG